MKFRWSFDAAHQQLVTPFGHVITVRDIARTLQDRVNNQHDLAGAWSGWRIRGAYLIGPGGLRTTPELLRKQINKQSET